MLIMPSFLSSLLLLISSYLHEQRYFALTDKALLEIWGRSGSLQETIFMLYLKDFLSLQIKELCEFHFQVLIILRYHTFFPFLSHQSIPGVKKFFL